MTGMYENATPRPWTAVGISVEAHLPEYRRSIATIYPDMRLASAASSDRMLSDAALIVHAVNNIERLEATNASLIDQVSELSTAPWPEWAKSLLSILREWTGPCPEDAVEGVDLPEELRIWLEGYRDELERATIAKALEGEAGNGAS